MCVAADCVLFAGYGNLVPARAALVQRVFRKGPASRRRSPRPFAMRAHLYKLVLAVELACFLAAWAVGLGVCFYGDIAGRLKAENNSVAASSVRLPAK